MKSLSVSKARSELPRIVEHVRQGRGRVVFTRHGKPVADLVAHRERALRRSAHSLRGLPITVAPDFDAPAPELWSALES